MSAETTIDNARISQGKSGRILAGLRQLRFARAFRIPPPAWPEDLSALAAFLRQIDRKRPTGRHPDAHGATRLGPADWQPEFLARLGTDLWRLRRKMLQPGTDRPLGPMRKAFRHCQALWDSLHEAGVVIREHDGERVPESGVYGLKSLAYQPTDGISHETVIETIKPSIYSKDQMIQMGEVIIGTPKAPADAPPPSTTAEQATPASDRRLRVHQPQGETNDE
jgi:hypothetical protein